ncbi:OsmC family protein [Segnochrobactrum spirostomi]|uniref:OsmC family protein n=1 Tax=Segnochrobactrum spirostomi TaxID=2608987 RepID=A0A6A7Y015_9HYPH|nr:OsmC family protein [Segnochrobactrum spirostomi]MQT12410.1 OsmC family protein [Segnochrobactrum spirostomi]
MATRKSEAEWTGDLKGGKGRVKLGSGAFEGQYSFSSRFENGVGTNPEELIAAAHAGCFSMALSAALTEAGHPPERIHTDATIHFGPSGGGFSITRVDLATEASVPGIDADTFAKIAADAKANCPVSKALAALEIHLDAKLV